MLLIGTVMAWKRVQAERKGGGMPAYIALFALFIVAIFAINRTNLRVIQADMVYKRAEPFERAANSAPPDQRPSLYDQAIAIYEHAVELAPTEDFYYLFLGRAYLEASSAQTDQTRRDELLQTAQERLQTAQEINPLNTDHTANLARLHTRWADQLQGDERTQKIAVAEDYYAGAMALSPQNSIIRNEYARLAYVFKQDCDESISRYEESSEIDPFYVTTRFETGEIQIACANLLGGEQRDAYFEAAIKSFTDGFAIEGTGRQKREQSDPRRWFQLAQLYQELDQYDEAISAYNNAIDLENRQVPAWNTLLQMALLYEQKGDIDQALETANAALVQAPDNNQATIQNLISRLRGETAQPINPTVDPPTDPADLAGKPRIQLVGDRPAAELEPADRNGMYATDQLPGIANPESEYEAVIVTEKGDIRILLYNRQAPLTVNNFVFLATQGFLRWCRFPIGY